MISKYHADAMAYAWEAVRRHPGCSTYKLPPVTEAERARLNALMSEPRPTLLEIERRVLRARYNSLPQDKRLRVLARVRKEVGPIGVRILSSWEHQHG